MANTLSTTTNSGTEEASSLPRNSVPATRTQQLSTSVTTQKSRNDNSLGQGEQTAIVMKVGQNSETNAGMGTSSTQQTSSTSADDCLDKKPAMLKSPLSTTVSFGQLYTYVKFDSLTTSYSTDSLRRGTVDVAAVTSAPSWLELVWFSSSSPRSVSFGQ